MYDAANIQRTCLINTLRGKITLLQIDVRVNTHTHTYTLTGGLFSIQYALSWQSNTTRSGFFLSLPALTHIRTDTNIEKEAEDFKNPPVHTVVPHLV